MQQPNDKTSTLEQISAKQFLERSLEILAKRRWWFIFSAALVLGATIIITRNQPRIYQAKGALYIDRRPPKVLSGVNDVITLGASGYWGTQQYYKAQKQILRSRDVGQMVVNRLGLASDKHFLGLDRPGQELSPEDLQAAIAKADAPGLLSGRIVVTTEETSMIARVSFEDTDPEFARDIVNAVMEAYRDRNLEQKRRATHDAFRDLRQILADMERQKETAEKKLLAFETENDLSDNRRKAVDERVLALHERLRTVQTERFKAQQLVRQLRQVQGRKDMFTVGTPGLMEDVLFIELKHRFLELTIAKRELETLYLSKHPKVRTVDGQLKHLSRIATRHLKGKLTAANSILATAVAEEKEIKGQLAASMAEDRGIRLAQSEFERRRTKRNETRKLSEMVANRLAEMDLTKQVAVNNVRILDPAVKPRFPVRPKVKLNYLLGALMALMIGFAVAFSIELLDNTIKSREQIESVLGVPYLGAIPTFDMADQAEGGSLAGGRVDLYAHFRPNSRVAEASRTLRTNILFMRPDRPYRTLVITSANPREGKTATATTLATTLASASGSCILVDTDLRKPRMHKVFGMASDRGVTNYILSRQPLSDFVRKTEVPGLDLLSCGPLPPNSSEIIHTERFRELVRELEDTYENVIFDSPPVEIVSDALVLATLVDGVVLIAHANTSKLESMRSAIRSLQSVSANLLGVVLSRTSTSGSGYGYYYGKGYRRGGRPYRYRYAAQPDEEKPPVQQEAG